MLSQALGLPMEESEGEPMIQESLVTLTVMKALLTRKTILGIWNNPWYQKIDFMTGLFFNLEETVMSIACEITENSGLVKPYIAWWKHYLESEGSSFPVDDSSKKIWRRLLDSDEFNYVFETEGKASERLREVMLDQLSEERFFGMDLRKVVQLKTEPELIGYSLERPSVKCRMANPDLVKIMLLHLGVLSVKRKKLEENVAGLIFNKV